jgi:hypothetical protein
MAEDHTLGDAPIDQQYRDKMRRLAQALDSILNDGATGDDRKTGFCLMVFPFADFDGRANYISNANRDDIIILLKEQLARFQGQPELKGTA